MHEHWKVDAKKQVIALEEGTLQEEKIKQTKNSDYENKYCNRQCFQLILFIAWLLFCGWCFHIMYQNSRSEQIKNHISNIIRERFRDLLDDSEFKIQNLQPDIKTSVIFVKPEVTINKLDNLLEETDLIKEQDMRQHIATITDRFNSVNENDNQQVVPANYINDLLITSLPKKLYNDRAYDEEFKKILIGKINANTNDNIVNDDKTESFFHRFLDLLHNIHNISDEKVTSDIKELKNNNIFIGDNNRLTLDSHENDASKIENEIDAPNKLENSEFDVTTISNVETLQDHKVITSPMNSLQDSKQNISNLVGDVAQDDRSDSSLFNDETDEQNLSVTTYPPIYPYYKPDSSEYSADYSWLITSRFDSTQEETSEQIENKPSHDIDDTNEDGHQVDDLSISSDMLRNTISFLNLFNKPTSTQDTEKQHSSEMEQNTSEDKKYKSIEDYKYVEFWLPSSAMQDIVKFLLRKSDIEQLLKPLDIADNSQLKLKDVSRLSATVISSLSLSENIKMIEDAFPRSHCKFEIVLSAIRIKCPAIQFNEKWYFPSLSIKDSTIAPKDVSHDSDNYDDYVKCDEDTISQTKDELSPDKNSNIGKDATWQHSYTTIENSSPDIKISNDALLKSPEAMETDFSANAKDQENAIYNTNEKEQVATTISVLSSTSDFDTTTHDNHWNLFDIADVRKEKSPEKQVSIDLSDYSLIDSDYSDVIKHKKAENVNIDGHTLEQNLAEIYETEMFNFMRMFRDQIDKHANAKEYIDMCPTCYRYVDLNKEIAINPHDSAPTFRKKRMVDNLTWQHETLNALKERDETTDLLKNLERIYQKMEVLAACIDKLHERYLFHNKLDDDCISNKFLRNIKERQILHK